MKETIILGEEKYLKGALRLRQAISYLQSATSDLLEQIKKFISFLNQAPLSLTSWLVFINMY